jgi:membrane-bound inhibitor of C-type lysozyme
MDKKIIIAIILVLLIGAGIGFYSLSINKPENISPQSQVPIAQATFLCKNNKTIDATFYEGEAVPVEPGEMPIPTGSVKIVLSDGRSFDLPQTISASGARYANNDESFVFWNKGNGALVLENDEEKDYVDCIVLSPDPGGLPNTYLDSEIGFSIRYSEGYSVDTSYEYQGFGHEKEIKGVKFTIPESLTEGTNLSKDSGVSIEIIPVNENCKAGLFFYNNVQSQNITDNGLEYSFALSEEGAVGHRYEEQVWAFSGTNSCFAVRYFIHYTVLENYPAGTISEFDKDALIKEFDKIRHSLTIL